MSCGCTGGGHDPTCPFYGNIVGVDGASAAGQGCAPGTGNAPVFSVSCSPGVRVQAAVDRAYRLVARLGFTPYRVFLVWELRAPDQKYYDVRRVELMPAQIVDMKGLKVELDRNGLDLPGTVRLQRVSPNQTTEGELLGHLDGKPWDQPGARFFYEVVQHERCAGQAPPKRWRFFPGSAPHLSTSKDPLGYSIDLTDQKRDGAGRDQSLDVGETERQNSYLDVLRT